LQKSGTFKTEFRNVEVVKIR